MQVNFIYFFQQRTYVSCFSTGGTITTKQYHTYIIHHVCYLNMTFKSWLATQSIIIVKSSDLSLQQMYNLTTGTEKVTVDLVASNGSLPLGFTDSETIAPWRSINHILLLSRHT